MCGYLLSRYIFTLRVSTGLDPPEFSPAKGASFEDEHMPCDMAERGPPTSSTVSTAIERQCWPISVLICSAQLLTSKSAARNSANFSACWSNVPPRRGKENLQPYKISDVINYSHLEQLYECTGRWIDTKVRYYNLNFT